MLSRLPAELRLTIFELLEPEECFNFAITSKKSWEVTEPALQKHTKLFQELRVVETRRDERTVWDLLDRILDEPLVAKYVRELQFDADRALCYDLNVAEPHALTSESEQPPSEKLDRYKKASEEFCYDWFWTVPVINGELATGHDAYVDWAMATGSDGPIVATALCMLPKLRTLRYTAGGDDYWLLHALRCVVKDLEPEKYIPTPFQSLKNVSITHYGTEGNMRWAWVHCIIQIPSVRSFTGNMIGGRWDDFMEDEDLLNGPSSMSNVTSLTFGNSAIEALAMDALLRLPKDLRNFRYQNGGSLVGYDAYDPRYFVKRLVRYHSNSLEHLILEDDSDENRAEDTEASDRNHPVYSLRTFDKLKSIACDLRDIITGDDRDLMKELSEEAFQNEGITITTNRFACIFNARALFPESLEELHIACNDFQLLSEARIALLDELLKSKDRALPNLKRVYLPVQESAELEEFKGRAAAIGVEYKPNPLVEKYDDIYCSVWS